MDSASDAASRHFCWEHGGNVGLGCRSLQLMACCHVVEGHQSRVISPLKRLQQVGWHVNTHEEKVRCHGKAGWGRLSLGSG